MATNGVAVVLGEDQELGFLAGDLHLVATRPADQHVRRDLGSFARHFNDVAGAERGGVIGQEDQCQEAVRERNKALRIAIASGHSREDVERYKIKRGEADLIIEDKMSAPVTSAEK